MDTAETMGKTECQEFSVGMTYAAPDPCNNTHIPNSLVVAKKYNEVATKINRFHQNVATVVGHADNDIGDVIRGAHAAALVNSYNAATFNPTVCDVCNVSMENYPNCDCNCPCPCSCNCGCACPCSCSCGCSCSSGGRA